MICARCYSDNIGVINIPDGRWVTTKDICGDCGYPIMVDESILRSIKIKKKKKLIWFVLFVKVKE